MLARLEQGPIVEHDNGIWKLSAMNKFIKQHGCYAKNGRVWCLGKYRGSVDPVMVLKESDLSRVWNEVHNRPDGHAGREPTLERFCTRYWFSGSEFQFQLG